MSELWRGLTALFLLRLVCRYRIKIHQPGKTIIALYHVISVEPGKTLSLIVAIDDKDRAVELLEHVKRHHPHIKVLARAFDVGHLYLLKKPALIMRFENYLIALLKQDRWL